MGGMLTERVAVPERATAGACLLSIMSTLYDDGGFGTGRFGGGGGKRVDRDCALSTMSTLEEDVVSFEMGSEPCKAGLPIVSTLEGRGRETGQVAWPWPGDGGLRRMTTPAWLLAVRSEPGPGRWAAWPVAFGAMPVDWGAGPPIGEADP